MPSTFFLNTLLTGLTLLALERIFAFSGSNIRLESWLLVAAFLFLFACAIHLLGGLSGFVFRALENSRAFRRLKYLLVAILSFIPIYFLGLELSKGGWIKAQSWVDYFPYLLAFGAALGAALVLLIFEKIYHSKYQRMIGVVGFLFSVGIFFLHSKMSGGVYHHVYFALYILGTIALALSFTLIEIKNAFNKVFAVLLMLLIPASIYVLSTIDNTRRADADLNSLTFSNLSRDLLPAQKMTFLEKVLVADSLFENETPPEVEEEIGNKDWNVLFVVVDTLRADIFEPWRRGNLTTAEDTPFMDSFFRDAIHFERGYAQGSGTVVSMPSLFRSLEVNERTTKFGRPLGARFSEEGFRTFAVVNNFFIEPRYLRTRSLLDGFEDVQVYKKREQNDLLKFTKQSFSKYEKEKWFAWIHFYNMHHTAFDGEFLKGVPKKEAYKRAAGWLDKQMKALVDDLKAKKLLSKTIIVFTADHGESFGDNGLQGHGRSVWEEEVRAPIAIRIPGVEGGRIDGTVGNIDMLPTLLDLLKLPKDPTLAGRSLVPYIIKREAIPNRSYYLNSVTRKQEAVVFGNQKLVFKNQKGILQRFDLDKDPEENVDLFSASGAQELRLRRDLVFHNPKIVKEELKEEKMEKLLLKQIRSLSDNDNSSSLFYAKLLALRPFKEGMKSLDEKILTKNNRDFSQHYRVLCRSKFSGPVRKEMQKRIENNAIREEMLREIVDLYCPSFSGKWVRKMMEKARPEERKFWLSLALQYRKSERIKLLPLMNTWLNDDALAPRERRLIFRNITKFGTIKKTPEGLIEKIREGLKGDERTVESAVQALGAVKDKGSTNALVSILEKSKSVRIKQTILMTLAKIDAENAFEIISSKMEEDSVLTFDGAKAILKLGDPRGVELLKKYGKSYPNQIVRANIRKFAAKLQTQLSKKKTKKN